ncbi:MAG: hypothetical protein AB7E76_02720 [Deferribacterales bacterium]
MRKDLPKTKHELIFDCCGSCRSEAKQFLKSSDGSSSAFYCTAEYCEVFTDNVRPSGVLLTPEEAEQTKSLAEWRNRQLTLNRLGP